MAVATPRIIEHLDVVEQVGPRLVAGLADPATYSLLLQIAPLATISRTVLMVASTAAK